MRTTKCAAWARVSTDRQDETNQIPALEQFAAHHGYQIVRRYQLSDVSAWNGAHHEALKAMLDDAYRGEFSVLLVWSLDRICREGPEELLKLVRQLGERHVRLVSIQETWCNGNDATTELMLSIAGWMAKQESVRRSERTKAGLARARAKGTQIGGRKAGAKDKRKRSTDGYRQAWSEGGKRRAAGGRAAS